MKRLHPALLPGFARSRDSKTMGARRGAEQQSTTTHLSVEPRRCRRRDHRANASYRQRTRLLWPSITRATTGQRGGNAGKLSTPAPAQCCVSPTRHRSSADTRIRVLHRVEFGYHDPEPSSSSHHTPRQPPTPTPTPKLTHRYSRRAPYVLRSGRAGGA